jgi:hypothetical protein
MKSLARGAVLGALAFSIVAVSFADAADARVRRRVVGGVVAGLVVGGLIAGAAAANAGPRYYAQPTYVAPRGRGCSEFRNRAQWNEEAGRPGRAQYWWDRYAECRGE